MAKKRGNNEGSITRRPDGRWMAQVTIGRDPATGKPRRATFYGKTRQDVADKLTKALRDKQQGTFVAPHKLTLGEWLQTWLWEYKQPTLRPLSFDHYETVIRRYLKPALGHIPLQDLRPEHVQRYYNEQVQQAEEKLRLGPGYTDQGLVFCRVNGAPIDPSTLDRAFSQALKRAGLPAIRLHDTRHTYATWLLEQGVSPKVVQTMLGHSSIRITMDVYSHVSLDLERQAAATLNAVLTRGLQ